MPRVERVRDLIAVLRSGRAASQQDIVESLRALGHEVTQATVSRDLKEIGAAKFRVGGEFVYRLPEDAVSGPSDPFEAGLKKSLDEFALAVHRSGTMLVVQTPPGHAPLLARSIDLSDVPGMVGTIAGDDTIFVAFDSEDRADRTREQWLGPRLERSITDRRFG